MATGILEAAGLGVTDQARSELSGYLARTSGGDEGRMAYDLRGDFGIEPDDLYQRFAFYFEAFPQVTREVF
jgi:hypothetical protein